MAGGKPYDVIVLGAGLSGLLTAALLARRGRHVLVLEEEGSPGGLSHRLIYGDYTFFRGSSLFLGFERDGLYDRLFMELGLSLSSLKREGSLFRKSSPPFQIVLPNHRLNFYEDLVSLSEELAREFPDQAAGIRSFLSEMNRQQEILVPFCRVHSRNPKNIPERIDRFHEVLKQKWTIRSFRQQKAGHVVDSFNLDPELRRSVELLLFLFTGNSLEDSSVFDLALLMGLFRFGMVEVSGGTPRFAEMLVEVVHKYQGDVIYCRKIDEVVVVKKKITRIQTDKETIKVTGDCVVNLPSSRLPQLSQMRPCVAFFYGIDCKVLPQSMKKHILVNQQIGAPPFGNNFLFITLSDTPDKWAAPMGYRALSALLFMEGNQSLQKDEIGSMRKSIDMQLSDLMPFSEGSITYKGYDRFSSKVDTRLAAIDSDLLQRPKLKRSIGGGYFTFPVNNLFALPDSGCYPVAHLWEAKSSFELANRLTIHKG